MGIEGIWAGKWYNQSDALRRLIWRTYVKKIGRKWDLRQKYHLYFTAHFWRHVLFDPHSNLVRQSIIKI